MAVRKPTYKYEVEYVYKNGPTTRRTFITKRGAESEFIQCAEDPQYEEVNVYRVMRTLHKHRIVGDSNGKRRNWKHVLRDEDCGC